MTRADRIASWLRERAENAGAKGFVFGLSGGIDSAVAARLCQLATPGNVLGVLLPCYSQPQDEQDARLVADAFQIPIALVDLSRSFDSLGTTLDGASRKPVGCSKWNSPQLWDCHSGSFQVVNSERWAGKLHEVCKIFPGRGTGA